LRWVTLNLLCGVPKRCSEQRDEADVDDARDGGDDDGDDDEGDDEGDDEVDDDDGDDDGDDDDDDWEIAGEGISLKPRPPNGIRLSTTSPIAGLSLGF